MHFLIGFGFGLVVGGGGIGYLAYRYGKKAAAVVAAVKS